MMSNIDSSKMCIPILESIEYIIYTQESTTSDQSNNGLFVEVNFVSTDPIDSPPVIYKVFW